MEEFNKVLDTIKNFLSTGIGSVILFIVVFLLGLLVIKLILIGVRKLFKKTKLEPTLAHFITSLIKFGLLLVYVLTLLSIAKVPITSLVAIITALTLAISLAIQSCLSNLANGMVLLANKPFKEGDFVEINGISGTVVEMKMFNTTLKTPTNEIITIPHNQTISSVIKDYSAQEKRRVDLTIGVSYDANVEQVKNVIMSVIESNEFVLKDDDKLVRLKNLNASSLDFTVRAWTKTETYWDLYYSLNESILEALRQNKIEIPYQKIDVNINK